MNAKNDQVLEEWRWLLLSDRLFNVVLKSVLLLVGIVGNGAVLCIYKFRLKDVKRDRYFIPYLAGIDLLACLATCVMSITKSMRPVTFPSCVLCKTLWYFLLSTTSTSAFYLLVICIIRYRKVCFLNKTELDPRLKQFIPIGVALFGFILAIPSITIYGERVYYTTYKGVNVSGPACSAIPQSPTGNIAKQIYLALFLLISVGVMITMIVLYSKIGRVIYQTVMAEKRRRKSVFFLATSTNIEPSQMSTSSTTMLKASTLKSETKTRGKTAKHNFTYMFMTVIIAYVISFTPSVIMILALSFQNEQAFWFEQHGFKFVVLYFISETYIFNHICNPFIYLYFDMKFRKEIRAIFKRIRYLT